MSRLASLHGPSAPSSNPVSAQSSPSSRRTPKRNVSRASPAPESPQGAPAESGFHRKLRANLREIASIVQQWDDMVMGEGLRAAKGVVDSGTELDNALRSNPEHKAVVATPKIHAINTYLSSLELLLPKLERIFRQLATCVESLEAIIASTSASRGILFLDTPVWLSWTPEQYLAAFMSIPRYYHQSLIALRECVDKLKDPALTWDEGKETVRIWTLQRDPLSQGQEMGWKDIDDVLSAEVRGWDEG